MVDKFGTLEFIDGEKVKIDGLTFKLASRVREFSFTKTGECKFRLGQKVKYNQPKNDPSTVSFLVMAGNEDVIPVPGEPGPQPMEKKPTAKEERIMEGMDEKRMIYWSVCLKEATQIRSMLGDFPAPDADGLKKLTGEVVIIAYNLLDETLRVWRKEKPAAVQEFEKC